MISVFIDFVKANLRMCSEIFFNTCTDTNVCTPHAYNRYVPNPNAAALQITCIPSTSWTGVWTSPTGTCVGKHKDVHLSIYLNFGQKQFKIL